MYPTPNYIWECKNCGEKLTTHQDEELSTAPKCKKCGGEMLGSPIVHRFPENQSKMY